MALEKCTYYECSLFKMILNISSNHEQLEASV